MDRFIANTRVPVSEFQRIGATALHVASKLIGSAVIPVESLSDYTEGTFSVEDLKVSFHVFRLLLFAFFNLLSETRAHIADYFGLEGVHCTSIRHNGTFYSSPSIPGGAA